MNELELILTDIFSCSRTDLYLNYKSLTFKDRELRVLERILRQRGSAQPIQYVLGYTDFMGLRLHTKKGVLIPRPETEILVQAVIDRAGDLKLKIPPRILNGSARACGGKNLKLTILDIGTGSGCIAVALAKFLGHAEILATDISREALDLARENAKLNNVNQRIKLIKSDLFSHKIFRDNVRFDMIISNPPYIPTPEITSLAAAVRNEPMAALDGGGDGLDFYRRISQQAGRFLKKGGLLFLELGYGQSGKIRKMFGSDWEAEKVIKDYQNIDRVLMIKKG